MAFAELPTFVLASALRDAIAAAADVDVRDVECALVRYALAHREHRMS